MFVYYLFEDYLAEQVALTKSIQDALSKLGDVFGSKVTLLMPNPSNAAHIEGEIRMHEMWGLWGHLPGVFLCDKPFSELQIEDEVAYMSFKDADPMAIANVIADSKRLLYDSLNWKHANPPPETGGRNDRLQRAFADAIEWKPVIPGIGLSFNFTGFVRDLLRKRN